MVCLMSEFVRAALQLPWIVGLAMLLAGWSMRHYAAARTDLRRESDSAGSTLTRFGAILFFAGQALCAPTWWQRLAAIVGAGACSLGVWGERRRSRSDGSDGPDEAAR